MKPIANKEVEWYTPPHILNLVYEVFDVDLDPASPAVPTVKAHEYYTKKENGLLNSWYGNVYLNPPYGRDIKPWILKAVLEYESHNVQNMLLLIPAKTDTLWFNRLMAQTTCFCTIIGRINFIAGDNQEHYKTGTFPSLMVLMSREYEVIERFYAAFSKIGFIFRHYTTKGVE